jgi:outer membrane protein TolC
MSLRIFARVAAGFAGLGLAAGCTLGSDPERPTTAADVSDTYVYSSEQQAATPPEVSPWWRTFGDETTTELVELALENNVDLQAAAASVRLRCHRLDPADVVRAAEYRPPAD